MRQRLLDRWVLPVGGQLVLVGILILGGVAYASGGQGGGRDLLVTQVFINAILVVGLQVYMGNTGVLSFGHMGFAAIGGYTVMLLVMDPTMKDILIPDAPFGVGDISIDPLAATVIAIALVALFAFVVGLGLIRAVRYAGPVAATMITLALLFLVREVAANFVTLTAGNRSGLALGPGQGLDGKLWVYIGLVFAVVVARLFRESRLGRLAQATRDDDLAARAMGINPAVPHMVALLLSVVLVTVGASLRVLSLGSMTPNFFFFDLTLLTLAMLIVGGRGSVTGSLVGVAVITVGNEVARVLASDSVTVPGLDWFLRPGLSALFLGGAMLGFMMLRPQGLLGDRELEDPLRRRLREKADPPEPPTSLPEPGDARLVGTDMTVRFGGFVAVDGVSIEVAVGEVVGLIGPNGAGKTTLINAITGVIQPNSGTWSLDGHDLSGLPSFKVARLGIARTFQNLRLFQSLTVRENIAASAIVAARHRSEYAAPAADALIYAVGLWDDRESRAGAINYGAARKLELVRAAALAPGILLLDEPTAGMWEEDSVAMVGQIRQVASWIGAGVLVIDHDLHFITAICDRIYVLDQGEIIAHGSAEEVKADPRVQAAYLGTDE
ncbi:MAG: branched-chain amino acid ABC transporter ATP-binding protein/permease [Acidimicrobiia bacterium]